MSGEAPAVRDSDNFQQEDDERHSGEENTRDEEPPPRKRFRIETEEEKNELELPKEMLEFLEDNFEVYIKEKNLRESVLFQTSHPKKHEEG